MESIENGTLELGNGAFRARMSGVDTKTVLLGIIVLIALGIFGYVSIDARRQDEDARKQYLDQHHYTQALLGQVIKNQESLIALVHESQQLSRDSSSETTYTLTLSQPERERLKLQMPLSLRQKLRGPS